MTAHSTSRLCGAALALLLSTTLGCRNPVGEACTTNDSCGEGFSCTPRSMEIPDSPRVCFRECASRADCDSPELCAYHNGSDGPVCLWFGGDRALGADCSDYGSAAVTDPCGVGLRCTMDRTGNAMTTHSIDRVCPTGFLCDLETTFNTAACLEVCDPSDASACDRSAGMQCIRTDYPGRGVIGLCLGNGFYRSCEDGTDCGSTRVCVDGDCVDPVDAPAVPFRNFEFVPELVD